MTTRTATPAPTKRKRKVAIALGSAALVGAASVGAYAYWSSTGAGTGSAASGDVVAVTVVQTSTVSNVNPGLAAQTLSGNFTNTNSSPVYITSVTASIASITKANGVTAACDATDYKINNPVMAVGAEVQPGSAQGSWTGASIEFVNKANANQDGCKGATVNLAYSAS